MIPEQIAAGLTKAGRIALVRGMALASSALCLPTIAAAEKRTRAQETPDA